MRSLDFVVVAQPKPQPRPQLRVVLPASGVIEEIGYRCRGSWQAFRRAMISKTKVHPRPYPDAFNEWQVAVKSAWIMARTNPFSGPLRVDIDFVLPRPESKCWKRKPMPREWDCRKGQPGGDVDNFAKGVLDALNEHAFADDSSVCRLNVSKVVAGGSEQAHARITITELSDTPDDDQRVDAEQMEMPF